MNRKETLNTAEKMVCGHREHDYGSPEDSFARIAKLWSAYMDVEFTPHDVAMMMSLLKTARIKNGSAVEDSYVDGCGYLACAAEIATNEDDKAEVAKQKMRLNALYGKKACATYFDDAPIPKHKNEWMASSLNVKSDGSMWIRNMDAAFVTHALNELMDLFNRHGRISVRDVATIMHIPVVCGTNYGWVTLNNTRIVMRDGETRVEFERPVSLENNDD